jgi:hypothetical protein
MKIFFLNFSKKKKKTFFNAKSCYGECYDAECSSDLMMASGAGRLGGLTNDLGSSLLQFYYSVINNCKIYKLYVSSR